jgi:hypothetical protein
MLAGSEYDSNKEGDEETYIPNIGNDELNKLA